jgi:hypothetical protein
MGVTPDLQPLCPLPAYQPSNTMAAAMAASHSLLQALAEIRAKQDPGAQHPK